MSHLVVLIDYIYKIIIQLLFLRFKVWKEKKSPKCSWPLSTRKICFNFFRISKFSKMFDLNFWSRKISISFSTFPLFFFTALVSSKLFVFLSRFSPNRDAVASEFKARGCLSDWIESEMTKNLYLGLQIGESVLNLMNFQEFLEQCCKLHDCRDVAGSCLE